MSFFEDDCVRIDQQGPDHSPVQVALGERAQQMLAGTSARDRDASTLLEADEAPNAAALVGGMRTETVTRKEYMEGAVAIPPSAQMRRRPGDRPQRKANSTSTLFLAATMAQPNQVSFSSFGVLYFRPASSPPLG